MERNTDTIISELVKGDRFYFQNDKKKVVYEITDIDSKGSFYNRINAYGYKMLPHDIRATPNRIVIFLRHKNEK